MLAILYKTWKLDINSPSIFFHLFRSYEILPLIINLFFLCCVWIFLNRTSQTCSEHNRPAKELLITTTKVTARLIPLILPLIAALIAGATVYAKPNLATMLSMDEFAAYFQSVLISKGMNYSTPPDNLRMSWEAVVPFTFATDSQLKIFRSPYLPGAALIYSVLSKTVSVPLIHALCIFVTGVCIHQTLRLIGFSSLSCLISVALVVLSPQVICSSWTHYAMTFHLFFNSLWLLVYMQRGNTTRLLTIPIGAFALILHQYIPHLVFSAPFILYDLYRKRYLVSIALLISYTIVLIFCSVGWFSFGQSSSQGWFVFGNGQSTNISNIVAIPSIEEGIDKLAHLILFFNWMPIGGTIVIFVGLFLSVTAFRRNNYGILALGSISAAIGVHLLCVFDQGHGWGYRYLHASLPAVAILTAAGTEAINKVFSYAVGSRLVILSAALTSLMLYYRTSEIDMETSASYNFNKFLKTIPEEILIVESDCCWYTRDIVRNDPDFSNIPLMLHSSSISEDETKSLCSQKSCRWLSKDQLLNLGFSPVDSSALIKSISK
jgi:hypothetical protein